MPSLCQEGGKAPPCVGLAAGDLFFSPRDVSLGDAVCTVWCRERAGIDLNFNGFRGGAKHAGEMAGRWGRGRAVGKISRPAAQIKYMEVCWDFWVRPVKKAASCTTDPPVSWQRLAHKVACGGHQSSFDKPRLNENRNTAAPFFCPCPSSKRCQTELTCLMPLWSSVISPSAVNKLAFYRGCRN